MECLALRSMNCFELEASADKPARGPLIKKTPNPRARPPKAMRTQGKTQDSLGAWTLSPPAPGCFTARPHLSAAVELLPT